MPLKLMTNLKKAVQVLQKMIQRILPVLMMDMRTQTQCNNVGFDLKKKKMEIIANPHKLNNLKLTLRR